MDVAAWLRAIGLPEYIECFVDNHIDEHVLPRLSAADLKDLGVLSVGHRVRLLEAIGRIGTVPPKAAAPVAPDGERRPVTVIFADLCDFTRMSHSLDDEDLRRVVSTFLATADRAILDQGGTIEKHIGDAVMGVFGAPVARSDDVARAARAALAIRDAMPGLPGVAGRVLQCHIGLSLGEAIVTSAGTEPIAIVGASVNVASRVSGLAGKDEILVTDAVARVLDGSFVLEDAGSSVAKGVPEPIRAWRLLGAAAQPVAGLPFVGRGSELAQVEAALDRCRDDGSGLVLLVRGEPGIGKSRFAGQVQEKARQHGYTCVAVHTPEAGMSDMRDPVRRLVSAMASLGDPPDATSPQHRVVLDDLLGLDLGEAPRILLQSLPEDARISLRTEAIVARAGDLATRSPLAITVEDVHWAGRDLTDVIAGLADAAAERPLVLLLTTRPDPADIPDLLRSRASAVPVLTLDLGPLRRSDALALTQAVRGMSEALRALCLDRAGGHPLFLEHLLRHAEDVSRRAVPPSLRGLIIARIDGLAPEDRTLIQSASVLGHRFPADALRVTAGRDRLDLAPLISAGLLRLDGDEVAFTHALIQEAVLRSLLAERVAALHVTAATWFRERDIVLHAEHLAAAGHEGAAAAFGNAARDRLARFRATEAIGLVTRGLQIASDPRARAELLVLRGEIQLELGAAREALADFSSARETGPSGAIACEIDLGLAASCRILDRLDEAWALASEARDLAAELGEILLLARAHYLRGNLCFPAGRVDACAAEFTTAYRLAEQAGDPEMLARALGGLGDAEYLRGHMLKAGEASRLCVDTSRAHGLARVEVANRPMLALSLWHRLELDEALSEARLALARARELSQLRPQITAHHANYLVLAELGRDDEALPHALEAQRITREIEAWRFEAENLAFLAELNIRQGREDVASERLQEALAIARRTGMAYFGALVLALLCRADPRSESRADWLAEAEALLGSVAVSHNHVMARRHLIDLALAEGDPGEALRHADALAAYAAREPTPLTEAVVARARRLAGGTAPTRRPI